MVLWRLSGRRYADAFDGGYGLLFDGRWNRAGNAVTYCATSPSLCVLEKLVHVEDPDLLPDLVMVRYEVPDHLGVETISLADLPPDWRSRESLTQQRGDDWQRSGRTALLDVPSAVVPLDGAPDRNVVINHRHPETGSIALSRAETFLLDPRLL